MKPLKKSTGEAGQRFEEFASGFRGKLFVSVFVYADETGTHDPAGWRKGSEMVGVAGYVATVEKWSTLCDEWKLALHQYDLTCFHFADYADKINGPNKPDWPYRHLDEKQRHKLLLDIAPLAARHTMFGVAALVSTVDYNKIVPAEGRSWLQHPYFLAQLGFYGAVLEEIKARFPNPANEHRLNFIFDIETDFQRYSPKIYSEVAKSDDNGRWMESIAFKNSRENPEIQIADLLAYRARQASHRLALGRESPTSRLDRDLGLGKHVVFACDDATSLKRKVDDVRKAGHKYEWPTGDNVDGRKTQT